MTVQRFRCVWRCVDIRIRHGRYLHPSSCPLIKMVVFKPSIWPAIAFREFGALLRASHDFSKAMAGDGMLTYDQSPVSFMGKRVKGNVACERFIFSLWGFEVQLSGVLPPHLSAVPFLTLFFFFFFSFVLPFFPPRCKRVRGASLCERSRLQKFDRGISLRLFSGMGRPKLRPQSVFTFFYRRF